VSWDDHLVRPGVVPAIDGVERGGDLGQALEDHYRWQASTWPRLASSLEELGEVRTRVLTLGERDVILQWNPGRETSTTARIDRASIEARPCFLCPENLPPQERGVPFGAGLVVLVNPAPITPLHLVVSHRQHCPQQLDGVLADAIEFAGAAARKLTVFYNGPRCGASAPDHLHLQAVAAGSTQDERVIESRLANGDPEAVGRPLLEQRGLRAWCNTESSRTLFVLYGPGRRVEWGIRAVMGTLAELTDASEEPPVNLLLRGVGDGIVALLYPRGEHRPQCYGAKGDDQVLISPGALDMAGLVITVRRRDFERVDEDLLRQIYRETSVDGDLACAVEIEARRRLEGG